MFLLWVISDRGPANLHQESADLTVSADEKPYAYCGHRAPGAAWIAGVLPPGPCSHEPGHEEGSICSHEATNGPIAVEGPVKGK